MIWRMVRAAIIVAAMTSAVATGASAQTQSDMLETLLSGFRARYGFPGATAAIVLPGDKIVAATTGFADVEARRPMTSDTRMLAASVGKSLVAATALSLEADDLLSHRDRVSDRIGGLGRFDRLTNHATITADDLLLHTAGLPDHVHLNRFRTRMAARMASGGPALSAEDAIAFVLDADPLFAAGSGWPLTDTSYLLLGLVIESAAGRSCYDLVAERFLDPVGLDRTAPSNSPTLPGLAVGYVADGNPFGLPTRTLDMAGRPL